MKTKQKSLKNYIQTQRRPFRNTARSYFLPQGSRFLSMALWSTENEKLAQKLGVSSCASLAWTLFSKTWHYNLFDCIFITYA